MSDQIAIGEFTLEISGDQIVVRDAGGAIVDTVDVDELNGELILPSGQSIDVAALFAQKGIETLETAAGPGETNNNTGYINGGPSNFHPFQSDNSQFSARGSAGALNGTDLGYAAPNDGGTQTYDPTNQEAAPILVTWSSHDPWHIAENEVGGTFGKVVNGDPADFTFEVSDSRFEVVGGVLRVRNGYTFDFEHEPGIELEITATSKTGDVKTLTTHIDVTDVNEVQTALALDNATIAENAAGAVIGALTVTDPDSDDDQSFAVSDSRFEVVEGKLKLKDGVSLDHESEGSVDVTVTATDNGGNQIQQTFAIQVGDANEAPTDINLTGDAVVENAAGAVIGTLSAIDPDSGDSHSFEVSDNRFEVVNGQLKLKDGVALDFEAEPSLHVTVTATDSAGNKVSEVFTLSVGDVNEAQTALALAADQVVENSAGAIVGTLTVTDPDAGDSQSFAVSDDRFEVVDGNLKLKDGVSLDHETDPSVQVQVTATDSAGHQIQQTFTINVANVNEAQGGISLSANTVVENAAGAVIGDLTILDGDIGDSQNFTVSDTRFEVVDGKLKLKDGVSLDYEGEPTVNVEVTATDMGGNQVAHTFTIAVSDVNEAQTSIQLSNSGVAENAKGAVIGTLLVADQDVGDKQTFSVSDSRFQVVNGQLKLKSGVSINYEAEPTVELDVTATDKAGHQITQTLTINVADVNEKQTAITLTGNTVTENSKGAVIGTMNVADPDAGDIQSYKVSDNRFEVVNGQLKLKDGVSLNYESAATVNVKVTATDSANHQISKTFAINVGNVNEAQTNMTMSPVKFSENTAGAVVGNLKVTDPDKGDTQSYTVSDSRFEIVGGQLKLKNGVALDYEQASKVKVDVTATDSAGHQITKTFSVNVGNVNEAQTNMTLSAGKVSENAAGVTIGTLKVTDPDAGDKQSFTVSDNRFEVVNNKLKLKPGVSLDYEQAASIDVDVTATDKGGNQITKTFTINVADLNEAQTALTLDNSSVAENSSGAVIGTLSVADPDAGDSQSFKVSDSRFEVVNGQLKLKDGVTFDHETTDSVDVTVTATDKGQHSISQTFTISIADLNEAQTGMSLSAGQVAENSAGATIGTLSVSDPDAGDTQSFQVSDSRFEVVDNQLKLKSGVSLDYEQGSTVDVTVTATDQGNHQYSKTFAVNVTDVNEIAPIVITKDGSVTNHVTDTVTSYNPTASGTVGNYLYSNDSAGVKAPAAGDMTSINGSNMTLAMDTEVQVTFQKEAAGNHNMVGTYQYDDSGKIVPGSVKFVWLDASAAKEGQLGATMVKDFLGYSQANTVSLGTMEAGTHVGFFTISNGASDSSNRTLISNAAAGADDRAEAMDAIASQLSIKVDSNGNGHVYVGNTQMDGDVFFSHDKSLNSDFNSGSDIVHLTSGVSANLPGQLIIGVEDLNGGGDRDYNDVVFSVNLGSYNVNKLTQEVVQPTVDFSDADGSTLSQAVIQTAGFQSGDALNIPSSNLFNVTVDHSDADYTITIVGKTGGETIDQYEAFANSIYFSTTSKTEGDRHIDYSVTDDGGLESNVATADITVDSDYHLSTSELGNGRTNLGGGDDVLYINTNSFGPVDMGDGHDTVHVGQQGRAFGHQDAVKLENIEAIDTTGYGSNNVSLSITDVLNMTDADNHLTVIGDKGDVVTLESSGKGTWEVVDQNADFTVFSYNDAAHQAVVEISNQLTAQIG